MQPPQRLSQYPWVVVRVECRLCPRKGCYRLARLAARYGPEMDLDTLLAILAADCPWWRPIARRRKYDPCCGVRYIDLDRNLPPVDDPQAPVYRQRGPGREDVPQRRRAPAEPIGPAPMLSGWPAEHFALVCAKCGRNDVLRKEAILRDGDQRITDLIHNLSIDCPRRQRMDVSDWCAARLEVPGE